MSNIRMGWETWYNEATDRHNKVLPCSSENMLMFGKCQLSCTLIVSPLLCAYDYRAAIFKNCNLFNTLIFLDRRRKSRRRIDRDWGWRRRSPLARIRRSVHQRSVPRLAATKPARSRRVEVRTSQTRIGSASSHLSPSEVPARRKDQHRKQHLRRSPSKRSRIINVRWTADHRWSFNDKILIYILIKKHIWKQFLKVVNSPTLSLKKKFE